MIIINNLNIYMIILIILILIIILIFITCEHFTNNVKVNNNAIVIVEPRKHALLKQVIDNFNSIMDNTWDLYVFHGISHKEFAHNATKHINNRNKFLIPLDTDNLDANEYNRLFRTTTFWDNVNAEHILVFQTDSVLCKNSNYKIEDFMKYDYVGCPYDGTIFGNNIKFWGKNNHFYGIGGLSYRNKSFMLDCINKNTDIDYNFAEDVLFSNCVADSKNKPESVEVLNKFCTQFHALDKSFGVHKPHHLDKTTFSEYCPEVNILENS